MNMGQQLYPDSRTASLEGRYMIHDHTPVPPNSDLETWVKAADLDWTVRVSRAKYMVDGEVRTSPDRYVTYCSDTGQALDVVGKNWHPVQPREILKFHLNLFEKMGWPLTHAGHMKGRRWVWAMADITEGILLGERLRGQILCTSPQTRGMSSQVTFVTTSLSCLNQIMGLIGRRDDETQGFPGKIRLPHFYRFSHPTFHSRVGKAVGVFDRNREAIRRLMDTPMDHFGRRAFFAHVLGLDAALNHVVLDPEKVRREEQAISKLNVLYQNAPGQQLPARRGTAWGALSAVLYHVDHDRRTRGNNRHASAWVGSGQALKTRALKYLAHQEAA